VRNGDRVGKRGYRKRENRKERKRDNKKGRIAEREELGKR
jgi:hypothetical protein